MTTFKPMLASAADLGALRFHLFASPKLDGIRAMVRNGVVVSRKLLPIPNLQVQKALGYRKFEGFDGELIVGNPTDDDVYRRTNSFVMSAGKVGDFSYYVFDNCREEDAQRAYNQRVQTIQKIIAADKPDYVHWLEHDFVNNPNELMAYEERMVEAGYEGVMLRDPLGRYKWGRSTANEGILLKVKRFEDSEAEIIGVEEEMANNNEALRDNLGRTKRSTAKAGKVGKGTMGALIVKDLKTGVEFNIGSGFTAADRAEEWKTGDIVKYKFFPVGVKDKPRHPIFIGRRDRSDM